MLVTLNAETWKERSDCNGPETMLHCIKYQVSVTMFSYFLQVLAKTYQDVFPVCQKPAKAQEEETASADRSHR